MSCEHETVVVHTTEAVRQDYHRPTQDWIGPADNYAVRSLEAIFCLECGEELTAELEDELGLPCTMGTDAYLVKQIARSASA